MKKYLIYIFLFTMYFEGSSQNKESQLDTSEGAIKYLISFPEGYSVENSEGYPLLFFLHGAGERGSDLNVVKVHGPPKLVEQEQNLPFIIVSPQCEKENRWASERYLKMLDKLYKEVTKNHNVDRSRVYLTGLSMGGQGTWEWAKKRPSWFAAIVPICGFSNENRVKKLKNVPVWVFHGGKDQVVPVKQSEDMVQWLKSYGSDVKFTVYPEAGHDSWTETYNNPQLFEWILSHKR